MSAHTPPEDFEVPVPEIDREIYAMPMFATLPVRDLDASRAWYAALGLVELAVMPAPDGSVQLVHLRRYRYQDLLLVPAAGEEDGATGSGARISFAHTGRVEDLEDVADALREVGGGEVAGPHATPWRAVELEARDPDGHIVVMTAPPEGPPPEGWDEFVRSTVVE